MCVSHQKGSVLIIVALALGVLIFMGFGVLQIANTGRNQANLQDVADAAALAGARELVNYIDIIPSEPEFATRTARVQDRVNDYINANYSNSDGTNTGIIQRVITVDWNTLRVRVELSSGQSSLAGNVTKNITSDVRSTATAELVIPDIDWCFAVDVSQQMLADPANREFAGSNPNMPAGGDPKAFIQALGLWVQRMRHVPTLQQRLGYAVVPYGNAVNIGTHHLDRIGVPRADGRSHQQAYNERTSLEPNSPQVEQHANTCSACNPSAASDDCPQCLPTPACFSGNSINCFIQYVDSIVGSASIQDKGLSVGCVLERRPDNYANDVNTPNTLFSPMVTFFETGCSSGHMYCLPPLMPLVRQGNPTFGAPFSVDSMDMWNVPSSGTPIEFDQLPMFQQGLAWCLRSISPQWDKVWLNYDALPDFSTFSGKGVIPNYGVIGDEVSISPEHKKIISIFAAGFIDAVSPAKVTVALSELDRTAYSGAPYAGDIQRVTRETCNYIRQQRYGQRQEGIDVHVINTNPQAMTPGQIELLRECATHPGHYYEFANMNINGTGMRELMRSMLGDATQVRLID